MADGIGVLVDGDRRVEAQFDAIPRALHDDLLDLFQGLVPELTARVQAAAPDRTGKLRSQIKGQVFDDKTRISGRVAVGGDSGNDLAKAGALEFGAHGTARVSAHEMRLDHLWGEMLNAPMMVMVEAHTRQLDLMAQRFLRDPFAGLEGEIVEKIKGVADIAIEETSA